MIRTLFLVCFLLLLLACGGQPGTTVALEEAKAIDLQGETRFGTVLNPGPMPFLPRGSEAILGFGVEGKAGLTITFEGLQPKKIQLEPGWNEVRVEIIGNHRSISWEERPDTTVYLAKPYLLPKARSTHPNVLLISIDTLRYDHFTAEHMPRLHALFADGQQFSKIYTPSPWTLPAHASLLTGVYPANHGARKPDLQVSKDAVPLAEVLMEYGYYTVALTEGNFVSARFGLARGFHRFLEDAPAMMENDPASVSRLAANLDRLKEVVDTSYPEPRFVFFHTYEVHCPFLPHEGREDPEHLGGTAWLLDNDGKALGDDVLSHLLSLYQGEVAYTSDLLAPMVEDLLSREDWLVLLVSDHGEEFGEHGGLLHADTLYQEVLHVPFAIAGHGGKGIVARPGSLVDVPPTLLSLIDLPVPDSWQGVDLLLPEDLGASRPIFAESFFLGVQIPAEDPRLSGVVLGNEKLVQMRNFGQFTAELYNLMDDPHERIDLSDTEIDRRDALFLILEAYLAERGVLGEAAGALTPEQLETMRSLGYIK